MLITFSGSSLASAFQKRIGSFSAKAPANTEDSDKDGMPDWWEERFSNEPYGLDPKKNDSQEDPDSDSLINLDEFRHGSHPFRKDTDEDLLEDGDEVSNYKTNPAIADTDGGGKPDGYEVKNSADPLNPDDDNISLITATINLNSDWNLISVPVLPNVNSITNVLAPISDSVLDVHKYHKMIWESYVPNDPDLNNLATVEPGWGYWIKMKKNATLTVRGSAAPNSINLEKGWNLVGYNFMTPRDISSALSPIHGKYDLIYGEYDNEKWKSYDPEDSDLNDLKKLKPGYGYWIRVTESCTWVLP